MFDTTKAGITEKSQIKEIFTFLKNNRNGFLLSSSIPCGRMIFYVKEMKGTHYDGTAENKHSIPGRIEFYSIYGG